MCLFTHNTTNEESIIFIARGPALQCFSDMWREQNHFEIFFIFSLFFQAQYLPAARQ